MRLALALLFALTMVAPAAAQGTSQGTSPSAAKPSGQGAAQAPAPGAASKPEDVMRQRILLRERFNKGWDIQPETAQERQRRCRSEAKKQYSAIHPIKRRKFEKDCIAHAGR